MLALQAPLKRNVNHGDVDTWEHMFATLLPATGHRGMIEYALYLVSANVSCFECARSSRRDMS
jgi:hypothetical protein